VGNELEQDADVAVGYRHELAIASEPAGRGIKLEAPEGKDS
jgi:hypothetical protein